MNCPSFENILLCNPDLMDPKGEVTGGDCALTTIADNMDGGLLCFGGGGG